MMPVSMQSVQINGLVNRITRQSTEDMKMTKQQEYLAFCNDNKLDPELESTKAEYAEYQSKLSFFREQIKKGDEQ